jgi:cbb3-type cytochrome oxidase subunit 3
LFVAILVMRNRAGMSSRDPHSKSVYLSTWTTTVVFGLFSVGGVMSLFRASTESQVTWDVLLGVVLYIVLFILFLTVALRPGAREADVSLQ